ncbi:hypothetical protein K0M31_015121 [Melipona bicolor]|uniref:Uncharacterized protein n=1 Tax=Melipona bicolor TaxID=60889 RepID=A0AA40FG73_9HYME|nr:hypothetical protein K0M31_015121 [Melipona bicolor]
MSSLTWYHVVHMAGKRHPQTFVDQSLSSQKENDERTDPPARGCARSIESQEVMFPSQDPPLL